MDRGGLSARRVPRGRGRARRSRGVPALGSRGALALLLALALASPARGLAHVPQDFAAAAELARAGRVHEARAVAESIGDPLASAQARVHVAWSGGDLVGALATAEEALARFPRDLYLLEQASRLAHALGSGERARTHARALATAVADASLAPEDARAWAERAAAAERDAEALCALHARRARSLVRARATVLVVGGLALFALVAPWRVLAGARGRAARHKRSSTPLPSSGS